MNKNIQTILLMVITVTILMFCGIGVREIVTEYLNQPHYVSIVTPISEPPVFQGDTASPVESETFITGAVTANVGELCVFQLNDPTIRADWIIVPPATCYVDSSGSSLAFASILPAKYTIIAAIIEESDSGQRPKIVTQVCDYGLSPEPEPTPNPSPTPSPNPVTISGWVSKNIPLDGRAQAATLAECYYSVTESIERGNIKTIDAAFSLIRNVTQSKVDVTRWSSFLDQLSIKITESLNGSTDVKKLATIFSEIAAGLKLE